MVELIFEVPRRLRKPSAAAREPELAAARTFCEEGPGLPLRRAHEEFRAFRGLGFLGL